VINGLLTVRTGINGFKVSIAKWLAANADILIIDEPTVGIDIKAKTYLHELIGEIAASGVSVILISSDMPEMVAVADRILVMHGFRIVGEVENDHRYETTSAAIMSRIHAVGDIEPRRPHRRAAISVNEKQSGGSDGENRAGLMELHVALTAAVPNGRWVDPQLDSLTSEKMRIVNGHAVPSDQPGLGIAWDWEAIDRQRVEGSTRMIR